VISEIPKLKRTWMFFSLFIMVISSCKEIQVRDRPLKNTNELSFQNLSERYSSSNIDADLDLALNAFDLAFSNASDLQLIQNFGEGKDIKGFYRKLLLEDDITPFRQGKLKWIRAFSQGRLVGWMTIEPDYHGKNRVYV